jgi:hypothetical protein
MSESEDWTHKKIDLKELDKMLTIENQTCKNCYWRIPDAREGYISCRYHVCDFTHNSWCNHWISKDNPKGEAVTLEEAVSLSGVSTPQVEVDKIDYKSLLAAVDKLKDAFLKLGSSGSKIGVGNIDDLQKLEYLMKPNPIVIPPPLKELYTPPRTRAERRAKARKENKRKDKK